LRAVIVLHGIESDPSQIDELKASQNYKRMLAAARIEDVHNSTIIIAPILPHGSLCNTALLSDNNSYCWELRAHRGHDWRFGGTSKDSTSPSTSTFSVLDNFVYHLSQSGHFPNLNTIVVTGHSGGSQLVQRYAALSKMQPENVRMRYVVNNPATYLYITIGEEQRRLF
jgi:hypothetical protein